MAKIKEKTFEEVHDLYASYLDEEDVKKVDEAYELANNLHGNQVRKSGQPYITHPIQVVEILAELRMDRDTLIAGFLHDVVEDTDEENQDIENEFGADVAVIIDGVTKLNKISYNTEENQLAENHRKLLLSMSKDIRVIIVKLADRLHNMRTLDVHRPEKQQRIASETLEIYAPLAHRLGLANIKWELEDLSLFYTDREKYKEIAHLMDAKREERVADVDLAISEIEKSIHELGIEHVEVTGRPKHIYSVYRKMTDKHKEFSDIYDLLAIRVLVDTVSQTYAVLGSIHSKWTPMPGRFKDYIALPKPNGYQSLHTTVICPNGRPIEVQIRTFEMHDIAEFGVAAHWAYKANKGSKDKAKVDNNDQRHLNVIQNILELQDDASDADQFIDAVKGDLFSDRIYAFTPKGDVYELPEGAGPLDMAFAIHSQVGSRATGAKVNGKLVPLNHQLKTGDIVEIVTAKEDNISRDWLELVSSRRAKNKIRSYFRQQDREINISEGLKMLKKYISDNHLPVEEDTFDKENLDAIAQELNNQSGDDMLALIGYGELPVQRAAAKLTEKLRLQAEKEKAEKLQDEILSGDGQAAESITKKVNNNPSRSDEDITIAGIDSLLIRLGRCCTPIPGDEIAGYITKGRGVSIHRIDCRNLQTALNDGQRLIDVEWNNPQGNRPDYPADLVVSGANRNGLLNDVLRVVNSQTRYIDSINGGADHNSDGARISVTVGVKNLDQLNKIIDGLKNIKEVYEVKRAFH
ncbi:MAG: bifunctional (p)ppGpp synthetase/guanosine-3',5'-bis(diphosphate) 3'-pyrophosphohydrolase [Lactobacillaceae bacterium]|jgi:GTP pyrophosphokinase|nr:bifunctional (p)ppGpp synthetase/guanosine-3',5'-bis(diphosphate) 3'-pyrophosphohydrolase [Lactobacillaceae bacterium]